MVKRFPAYRQGRLIFALFRQARLPTAIFSFIPMNCWAVLLIPDFPVNTLLSV